MSFTEEQKTVIKATIPILESGGEVLTKHFYGIMLKEFPEVLPFFNRTHQATGDQPRALARAVLMYAKNIDRLENLGSLVAQIVNKHVALDVKAEHYPIVGQCLIRAMTEVLGPETATETVLGAWGAAYNQLANILINAESAKYKEHSEMVGGWMDERAFKLVSKTKESSKITSFVFSPADGKAALRYEPGQYVAIVRTIKGDSIRRTYSLSQPFDAAQNTYRISVKHEEGGAMSTFLHEQLAVGDEVILLPPAGKFGLQSVADSDKPVFFIAAGVGITPLLAMVQHLLATNNTRPVTFLHCARNEEEQAFKQAMADLASSHSSRLKVVNWYSQQKGRLQKSDLEALLPASDCDVYMVGPKQFMATMKKNLIELSVPAQQISYEFFGPAADI